MHPELKDLRVLVVDDSRAMRRIVKGFMDDTGVKEIVEAAHGRAALEIMAVTPVDLVVCDLNMPVMNGLELLQAVRAGGQENLCFVMLTVEAVQKTMNQSLALGADSYIVKPVTKAVFLDEVRQVLSRRANGSGRR